MKGNRRKIQKEFKRHMGFSKRFNMYIYIYIYYNVYIYNWKFGRKEIMAQKQYMERKYPSIFQND